VNSKPDHPKVLTDIHEITTFLHVRGVIIDLKLVECCFIFTEFLLFIIYNIFLLYCMIVCLMC